MADEADLYFEEVFWRPVYLFKALLSCIGHGLHGEGAGQRLPGDGEGYAGVSDASSDGLGYIGELI